ncbi:hypothetical protein P9705_001249 [Enterococcus faecalis]|nr:hypothetical protein [Enterococcus faecalis]
MFVLFDLTFIYIIWRVFLIWKYTNYLKKYNVLFFRREQQANDVLRKNSVSGCVSFKAINNMYDSFEETSYLEKTRVNIQKTKRQDRYVQILGSIIIGIITILIAMRLDSLHQVLDSWYVTIFPGLIGLSNSILSIFEKDLPSGLQNVFPENNK